jgi:hypothetical protein
VLTTVGDRIPLASSEGGNMVATAGADEDNVRKEVLRHSGKQGTFGCKLKAAWKGALQ